MMMSSSPLVSSSITNGGNQAADVELQRENGVAAEPSDNGHTNNHNREPTTKDNDSTSNTTKEAADAKAATGEDKENAPPNGDQATLDESMKNESSTLSTAFTISFEDDAPVSSSKKQFGIRDSIRKFAPPKPHTIEKPRPSKSDQQGNQDNSYMSIESAPGGCPGSARQTFRRDPTNSSCRSSGRKSDSSRHSNISESAAFLIDKMLNCKQGESLSSLSLSEQKQQKDNRGKGGIRSRGGSGATPGKKLAHSSDDILDDEIDFCEERSDNGTYIVGTDPESDAARRKIDELFGVVKAAEASLMKQASAGGGGGGGRVLAGGPPVARPSRLPDKRPTMSRERQEHINRLAGAGRHSSRSSSSSRQELASTSHRRRESRNSSCDRTSKLPSSRHRRATSQSSRQSSSGGINHHDPSDGDTQSSRSSLQNEIEPSSAGASSAAAAVAGAAQNPSMKFNRAFALRRARLGLGEPAPLPRMGSNASNGQLALEPESLNLSPRRTLAQRYANHQSSSGGQQQQQSMSRNDGGRFSLRMRNNPVPSRLMQGVGGGQQATIIDSYLSKVVSSSKGSTSRFNRSPGHVAAAASGHALPYYHQNQSVHSTSAIVAGPPLYQSSDELELLPSPSQSAGGYRSLLAKSLAARRENLSELEADIDYATNSSDKFNYSLNLEQITANTGGNNRLCNSAGRRGSSGQLGALDCLVISAISSLSVKIRGSVCDLMVEHAKRLPEENETRLIVEEILPQLAAANSSRPKSPTSIEEIDQSLYFDLAQALKNLKKVEQMVDVMKQISSQIPATAGHSPSQTEGGGGGCSSSSHNSNSKSPNHLSSHSTRHHHNNNHSNKQAAGGETGGSESNPNSESTSMSPT